MNTTTKSQISFLLQAKKIVDTLMDYPDGIPKSALNVDDEHSIDELLELLCKHNAIKIRDNIVEHDFMYYHMVDRFREFQLLIETEAEHYDCEYPSYGEKL